MKYYLIVGEASGDLHASRLMRSLKEHDPKAEFRFFGGDLMSAEGGERVRHYRELAYMGLIPVLMHLPTILKARTECKKDIMAWQPDAVILVDYAGFNLSIAEFLHNERRKPGSALSSLKGIYYYISPKIWAWKEYRIKNFKRDVDEMFCILPFETEFFERHHNYPVHYVGNPTANEVEEFRASYKKSFEEFIAEHPELDHRPIIALLAGSRRQEIKDNLQMMLQVAQQFPDYQMVLAGAPSIEATYYEQFLGGSNVKVLHNETYPLLMHATAALVTSGTATLETCCFNVPQVVLYKTPLPRVARFIWDHFFKVRYISLVNLIAGREVVSEMMADKFRANLIIKQLQDILPGTQGREKMLKGYAEVASALSQNCAPDTTARLMTEMLKTTAS